PGWCHLTAMNPNPTIAPFSISPPRRVPIEGIGPSRKRNAHPEWRVPAVLAKRRRARSVHVPPTADSAGSAPARDGHQPARARPEQAGLVRAPLVGAHPRALRAARADRDGRPLPAPGRAAPLG